MKRSEEIKIKEEKVDMKKELTGERCFLHRS